MPVCLLFLAARYAHAARGARWLHFASARKLTLLFFKYLVNRLLVRFFSTHGAEWRRFLFGILVNLKFLEV